MPGFIHCGDNLDVLRDDRFIASGSVDLVYLDPPFNSQRTYNLIHPGARSQEEAFKDSWSWAEDGAAVFAELVAKARAPLRLRTLLKSLRDLLIDDDSDLLAYLSMMSARLVELHRVLKPTGSLYLHCDPTASHYLKLILDALFGLRGFRNEIIWKRSSAHSDGKQGARHFGRIADSILFYAKSDESTFNQLYGPYDATYIAENYKRRDADGRIYRIDNIQGPGGAAKGNPFYEFLGVERYWRYSRERMKALYDQGRIIQTRPGAVPQYKRYLDEMPGVPLQTVWTDIPVINNRSKEMLGYPTQKPLALLERILLASSNPGDIVLDPFCGCGTTVESAERLGRRWIGIDIARKAVEVIERRFAAAGLPAPPVIWHPKSAQEAEALAERDPAQFEDWARHRIGAEKLHRYDRGIDGEALFEQNAGAPVRVIVSVKGGRALAPGMVRDLRGTIEREKAAIGILVTMHAPSPGMRQEAARAEFIDAADADGPIPRVQILTIAEIFAGRGIRAPGRNVTPRPASTPAAQLTFPLPGVTKTRPAAAKAKKKRA